MILSLALTLLWAAARSGCHATEICGTTNTPNSDKKVTVSGTGTEIRRCSSARVVTWTGTVKLELKQCQTLPMAATFFRLSFCRDALEKCIHIACQWPESDKLATPIPCRGSIIATLAPNSTSAPK